MGERKGGLVGVYVCLYLHVRNSRNVRVLVCVGVQAWTICSTHVIIFPGRFMLPIAFP